MAGLALALSSALTLAASLWVLAQNPFAAPLTARSAEAAAAALDRALTLRVTPEWAAAEVEAALAAGDMDRLLHATTLATERGLALPRPLMERALAAAEAAESPGRRMADCAACAWDIAQCPTVALIAACALPVEVTPLGDANALRRNAAAWAGGAEVDRLEVGLAVTGLAASAAVLATAGSSAVVKAGATALRLARRAGTLSPGLTRVVRQNADLGIDRARLGGWLSGDLPLERVADPTKVAVMGGMATDLGRIAARTSPAEAVVLIRHADTPAELATLARLADVRGGDTAATLRALGKARALRMMHRLTDLALAALALLAALGAQLVALALWALRRAVR
ncbi:hypothetical protein DXV76_03250 [Rhodobacteraceae bacterium CCMM004]|nr:hypothetical protein DXV76_03250 [Rhodobacteraceae bacterium CCMM004]